jgi:hypothetical protein
MLPLIRLCTLIAFAAHAGLGCCLTHGKCSRIQCESLATGSCAREVHAGCEKDHDQHDHPSEAESEQEPPVNHVGVETESLSWQLQPIDDRHEHSCADLHCVFDHSFDPVGPRSKVTCGFVFRCRDLEGLTAFHRQCYRNREPYRDRSTRSASNRAITQVWLI